MRSLATGESPENQIRVLPRPVADPVGPAVPGPWSASWVIAGRPAKVVGWRRTPVSRRPAGEHGLGVGQALRLAGGRARSGHHLRSGRRRAASRCAGGGRRRWRSRRSAPRWKSWPTRLEGHPLVDARSRHRPAGDSVTVLQPDTSAASARAAAGARPGSSSSPYARRNPPGKLTAASAMGRGRRRAPGTAREATPAARPGERPRPATPEPAPPPGRRPGPGSAAPRRGAAAEPGEQRQGDSAAGEPQPTAVRSQGRRHAGRAARAASSPAMRPDQRA